MRKVLSKDHSVVHYLPLGPRNLDQLPALLTHAAQAGHWVLLDNLQLVEEYVPAI